MDMYTDKHSSLFACVLCVLQNKRRDQQGDDGHPGFLQSQSQTGGVSWRVGEHTPAFHSSGFWKWPEVSMKRYLKQQQ